MFGSGVSQNQQRFGGGGGGRGGQFGGQQAAQNNGFGARVQSQKGVTASTFGSGMQGSSHGNRSRGNNASQNNNNGGRNNNTQRNQQQRFQAAPGGFGAGIQSNGGQPNGAFGGGQNTQSQPSLFGAGANPQSVQGGFGSGVGNQQTVAGGAFGVQSQNQMGTQRSVMNQNQGGGAFGAGMGAFSGQGAPGAFGASAPGLPAPSMHPMGAPGLNKNRYEYAMPVQAQGNYLILGKNIKPSQQNSNGLLAGTNPMMMSMGQQQQQQQQPGGTQLNLPPISPVQPQQQTQTRPLPGILQQQQQQPQLLAQPQQQLGGGMPSASSQSSFVMGGGGGGSGISPIKDGPQQPQDIAQSFTVSSGAFKIVALTDAQLREVTLKKTGQIDSPFVIQANDYKLATASKTPSVNGMSSKMNGLVAGGAHSPIRGYGFESCALNTRMRRLPDGLGAAGSASVRKITISPDKRSAISSILVAKYLPSEAECR